ncbi:N-acetylneuraminate synthase family protein [candidate division KSB1 bacterium]|nr:N-acetylneuraminate synthase family protein [candidate division KSB1 bacterium]
MSINFVAEVSSNHNRDLYRCLSFVEKSAGIGCSAVKFQLFKIDQLFAPEVLQTSVEHRRRKDWELPVEFLPELTKACRKANIQLACTPFYLKAVEELFPYVDFYKIASYELLWNDLLIECAKTDKPVVLSTGMATLQEIRNAVETLRTAGCKDLTLLHCVSGYPAPVAEANLAAIETLRHNFEVEVGWSDHTVTPGVIYRAVHRWQASMIEFHLDLEGLGAEFETGHCWLPNRIGHVIRTVNEGLLSDGIGEKLPTPSELPDRDWRADPEDGLRPLKRKR